MKLPPSEHRQNGKRPIAAVPRLLLTRAEAAASLGMSLDHFERHVQPYLRFVRSGQKLLVPIAELERWIERHAYAPTGGERVTR